MRVFRRPEVSRRYLQPFVSETSSVAHSKHLVWAWVHLIRPRRRICNLLPHQLFARSSELLLCCVSVSTRFRVVRADTVDLIRGSATLGLCSTVCIDKLAGGRPFPS